MTMERDAYGRPERPPRENQTRSIGVPITPKVFGIIESGKLTDIFPGQTFNNVNKAIIEWAWSNMDELAPDILEYQREYLIANKKVLDLARKVDALPETDKFALLVELYGKEAAEKMIESAGA